jgi:BspA type Leucine rich repeat region (6 copies)/Domain of unknown function (DUF6383)
MKKQNILFLCLVLSTILSAQVSKTVNCTAGALSSLLSGTEKSTVTDLTLTGTIDARDFKIMRDSMPTLANIDMGTATIDAYQNNLANQIPIGAFYDTLSHHSNYKVQSITLPNYITRICKYAFANCVCLNKNMNLPNSITSIDDYAFYYCSALPNNLTLPNGLSSIGNHAFEGCLNIFGNPSLPNSLNIIGDQAFANCIGITGTITIPISTNIIGKNAFRGCSKISGLFVDSNNNNYSSENGILYDKNKTILLQCPAGKSGNVSIPNTVLEIGECAFEFCKNLTGKLKLPSSLIKIDKNAFYYCQGFTGSINIPNSVIYIGDWAFDSCIKFDSISISNSICDLGICAFQGCNSVKYIKTFNPNPIKLNNSSVFNNINHSTCRLYVPKGSKAAYQSADVWKDFTNIVEYDLPTGINDITASGTSLYVTDGQLHIKNAPIGEQVRVTSILGMLVYNGVSTTDELTVSLPQHGVYVVTVGSKSQSVVY